MALMLTGLPTLSLRLCPGKKTLSQRCNLKKQLKRLKEEAPYEFECSVLEPKELSGLKLGFQTAGIVILAKSATALRATKV